MNWRGISRRMKGFKTFIRGKVEYFQDGQRSLQSLNALKSGFSTHMGRTWRWWWVGGRGRQIQLIVKDASVVRMGSRIRSHSQVE